MGRTKATIFLILSLIIIAPLFGNVASADREIQPWDIVCETPPVVYINYPSNGTVIYSESTPLNITVTQPYGWAPIYRDAQGNTAEQILTGIGYLLDGQQYGTFPASSDLSSPFKYLSNLTLSSGYHTLQIYANATGYVISLGDIVDRVQIAGWSNTIYFQTLPSKPTINIQSLSINGTSADLNFTINEPAAEITYSLDNQANVSITGNTTLTNLPYGTHNLTVYATNPIGNTGFQKMAFTVPNSMSGNPSLTTPIITAIAITISGIILALIIFRRHQKTSNW